MMNPTKILIKIGTDMINFVLKTTDSANAAGRDLLANLRNFKVGINSMLIPLITPLINLID